MGRQTTAFFNIVARSNIAQKMTRAGRSVRTFFKNFRKYAQNARRALQGVNNQLNNITSKMRGAIPGLGMLSGVGAVFAGREAILATARLESMETAIRHVSGTSDEAEKNLKFLHGTARGLGLDVEVAAEGFKKLVAAASKTQSMKSIRKMFYGLAASGRVLGLDASAQERIFYALSEMFSKGTVMAQELKLQIGNALPGAYGIMAEAASLVKGREITTKKLGKMMKAGDLKSDVFVPAFIDVLLSKYEKGVLKAKDTTAFALGVISYDWKMTVSDIGMMLVKSGILEHVSAIVLKVRSWVKANEKLIATKLKNWLDNIVNFGKWVIYNGDAILRWVKTMIALFIAFKTIMLATNIAVMLTNPVGQATLAIMLLASAFALLWGADKPIDLKLPKYLSFINDEIEGLRNLVQAFKKMLNGDFTGGFKHLKEFIAKGFTTGIKKAMTPVRAFIEWISGYDIFDAPKQYAAWESKTIKNILNTFNHSRLRIPSMEPNFGMNPGDYYNPPQIERPGTVGNRSITEQLAETAVNVYGKAEVELKDTTGRYADTTGVVDLKVN
jgi:tape measure domain-containing protein